MDGQEINGLAKGLDNLESSNAKDEPDLTSFGSSLHSLHFQEQQARNERLLNMRKAKSRNAARNRRGKENYEFYELAKLLPIPTETSSQLDKASIIRLTMSYLRMREFAYHGIPSWDTNIEGPPPNRTVKDTSKLQNETFSNLALGKMFECQLGSHLLQSLDGFLFTLNCQGKVLYVSETVSMYLGLSQVEVIGSSIFDYTHPADQSELAIQLGLVLSTPDHLDSSNSNRKHDDQRATDTNPTRSVFVRMKSTLTKRGVNFKSSSYRVIHLSIRSRKRCSKINHSKKCATDVSSTKNGPEKPLGVYGVGTPLSPPAMNENVPIGDPVFITRLNPSFKVTYCDLMAQDLLGYNIREIVGSNLYHKVHAGDVEKLKLCHMEVLRKGQVMTPYYRWLHKSGGYVWVHSCVTMLTNQRLYPEQSFIWINYAISEPIKKSVPCDILQLSPEEIEERQKLLQKSKQGKKSTRSKPKASELQKSEISPSGCPSHHQVSGSEKLDKDKTCQEPSGPPKGSLSGSKKKENASDKPSEETVVKVSNGLTEKGIKCCNNNKIDKKSCTKEVCESEDISRFSTTCKSVVSQDSGHGAEVNLAPKTVTETLKSCKSVEKNSRKRIHSKKSSTHTKSRKTSNKESDSASEKERQQPTDKEEKHEKCSPVSSQSCCCDHQTKTSSSTTESISEYLDADSVVWFNPPNKEISNHNDLPPGIKQMHGLWAVKRTPSAVHHHYPFGINPALLHSNPVLAKIMMASFGGCTQHFASNDACLMATPVQFMSPVRIPALENLFDRETTVETQTPSSVAAVLEELKKDPLHKVNPPNKVVIPAVQGSKHSIISDCKQRLHSLPSLSAINSANANSETMILNSKPKTSATLDAIPVSPKLAANAIADDSSRYINSDALIPQTILAVNGLGGSNLLFNGSHSSLLAVTPDTVLPIVTSSLQPPHSPYVIQPFAFPQVGKLPSVPL